jgi:hypothetical protein
VRELKAVGSDAWNLMREGEAEKQVFCFFLLVLNFVVWNKLHRLTLNKI